ncbi:hypothetical protein [[Eubacterium] hominis]|uniref:hypothetical protein n=1 Tax=[Eubacterium] hominis TaxID=2764325 RepID=UPI003A4E22C0
MQFFTQKQIKITKERSDEIQATLIPFAILFLMLMLKKTYYFNQSSFFMSLFNIIEWPMYALLFFIGIHKKHYQYKEIIIGISLLIVFMITYIKSGFAEPLKGTIIVFGMKNINYKDLIKTMYYVLIVSIIVTLLMYILGISDAGVQRRGSIALGYIQVNAIGFVLMFLTFLSLLKSDNVTNKNKFWLLLINIFGYIIADSRTGFILACSSIFLMSKTVYKYINNHKLISTVLSILPIICCIISVITALTYETNVISQILDKLLTNRIWLNHYNLTHYKIPLFGQSISLWNMTDSFYNPVTKVWSNFMTVDSTYVISLLCLGLISTIVILILYQRLIIKLRNHKYYGTIIVLSLLCLYGFTESSMLSIFMFFPFLIMLNDDLKYRIS